MSEKKKIFNEFIANIETGIILLLLGFISFFFVRKASFYLAATTGLTEDYQLALILTGQAIGLYLTYKGSSRLALVLQDWRLRKGIFHKGDL